MAPGRWGDVGGRSTSQPVVLSAILLSAAHKAVPGRLPEWPKGAVCKTVGKAYVGSNPTPATPFSQVKAGGTTGFVAPVRAVRKP
jgi:hypothetical protein